MRRVMRPPLRLHLHAPPSVVVSRTTAVVAVAMSLAGLEAVAREHGSLPVAVLLPVVVVLPVGAVVASTDLASG